MKTETCKLYSRDIWIFPPYIIKIDPYNFELYRFKVGPFFETQCTYNCTLVELFPQKIVQLKTLRSVCAYHVITSRTWSSVTVSDDFVLCNVGKMFTWSISNVKPTGGRVCLGFVPLGGQTSRLGDTVFETLTLVSGRCVGPGAPGVRIRVDNPTRRTDVMSQRGVTVIWVT